MKLSPIQTLVIAKAIKENEEKEVRKLVKPGKYAGAFTARIQFGASISEAGEAKPTARVPWQHIALLALSKLNPATIAATISDAAVAAYKGPGEEDSEPAESKDPFLQQFGANAELATRLVKEYVDSLPMIPRAGQARITALLELAPESATVSPHSMTVEALKKKVKK